MFFNLAFCLLVWQDKFGRAGKSNNGLGIRFQKIEIRRAELDDRVVYWLRPIVLFDLIRPNVSQPMTTSPV